MLSAAEDIIKEIEKCRSCVAWLGYSEGKSTPITGSHLLGFTKSSTIALKSYIESLGEDLDIMGFDSFLRRVMNSKSNIVKRGRKLGYQKEHPLKKRK